MVNIVAFCKATYRWK